MKGKLVFILGAAVGYVLGSRAGRERYEQIKRGAQTVWETPPVQKGAELAREAVDVKVTELKSAALAFGSQLFGSLAQKTQSSPPAAPPAPKSETATPKSEASETADAKPARKPAAKPAARRTTKSAAKSTTRSASSPQADKS